MSDAEWAQIARRLPPQRRWGGRAGAICARSSKLFSISWRPAASGARCRGSFRRARQCRAISTLARDGPGHRSQRPGGARAPALGRSPTPSAGIIDSQSRPPKAAVRAAEPANASGAQAPHRHRHQGFLLAVRVHGPTSRIPTARFRCCARLRAPSPSCAMSSPTVSTAASNCSAPSPIAALDHRDRRAAGRCQRLPAAAAAMGGRAHLRLARTLPAPRQGLRGHHRQRNSLAPPRQPPAPHKTPRKTLITRRAF